MVRKDMHCLGAWKNPNFKGETQGERWGVEPTLRLEMEPIIHYLKFGGFTQSNQDSKLSLF